jgi:hypothetical protein
MQGMQWVKTRGEASLYTRNGSYYIVVGRNLVRATDSLRDALKWLAVYK